MTAFDPYARVYQQEVEHSIAFAKVDHAKVTARKVEHLLALCNALVGPPAGQRLLDVGCGVGLTDGLLVDHVGSLQGIDVSQESVAQAAETNPAARYTSFDGVSFPLADGSVDLAFAICVLHHVEPDARDAFAAELRRVVRPGGIVIVFEHNPINPLTRVAVSRCEFDENVTLSRLGRTARLLVGAELRVERRAYIIFTTSSRWSARADRLLGAVPVGAQYYIAARRPVARYERGTSAPHDRAAGS
jgi:SAM-dependent methyltransferase